MKDIRRRLTAAKDAILDETENLESHFSKLPESGFGGTVLAKIFQDMKCNSGLVEQERQIDMLKNVYFENFVEFSEFKKLWKTFMSGDFAIVPGFVISNDGAVFCFGDVLAEYFFACCFCEIDGEMEKLFEIS